MAWATIARSSCDIGGTSPFGLVCPSRLSPNIHATRQLHVGFDVLAVQRGGRAERGGKAMADKASKRDPHCGTLSSLFRSKRTRKQGHSVLAHSTQESATFSLPCIALPAWLCLSADPHKRPYPAQRPVGDASHWRVTRPYDNAQRLSLSRPLAQGWCKPSDSRYQAKGSIKSMISTYSIKPQRVINQGIRGGII